MQPFLQCILCADDDECTRELIDCWLSLKGYQVKTAKTSSEVLRLARQEPFDLYLLDDWFPDRCGKDLIVQLRHLNPHPPIVVISGDVRAANQDEILRLGAQAFFPKPLDLDEVTATIAQLICTAEQEQSAFAPPPAPVAKKKSSRNEPACAQVVAPVKPCKS